MREKLILTKEQIVQKFLDGKPISIVRCGDGEGIVLNAMSSVSALQICNESVLRRQMGYWPTVPDIEAIRNNLIEAYANCDIIGLPMHKQATSGHWTKVAGIINENVPGHTETICDIDIAYQMLDDGSYDKLLQNRHVLNYISCRDLDEGFKRKWNVGVTNKFQIAPEAKFTSGYDGDVHYPTQFSRIPRWMEVQAANFPGSLLLVGAGVIGKIYCNWWRDLGGVAMDVGGAMDIWAGRITRGPERGLDKEDTDSKHKL